MNNVMAFLWYFWGFYTLITQIREFGGFQDIPVNFVIIIATFFISGSVYGAKGK